MKERKNLWPSDLQTVKITTPRDILIEQALYLEEATKNTITARVKSYPVFGAPEGNNMIHDFIITAPSLGNYQFTLLSVRHGLLIYPLNVYDELSGIGSEVSNENQFTDALGSIFNSDKTRNAIGSLMAQTQ